MGRWLGVVALAGCSWHGPACEDVSFGELTVEEGTSWFSWSGEPANGLEVYAGEVTANGQPFNDFDPPGEPVWSLDCLCRFEAEDPDSNAGCGNSEDEIDFRACIQPGVEYGVAPETPTGVVDVEVPPAELVAGATYTASVHTYCTGDRLQDPDYNGGDPYHPHISRAYTAFVAP